MKVAISKSANKIFYYIQESYRKNGKVSTRTVEKVGEHYDLLSKGILDPKAYAEERAKKLTEDLKSEIVSYNQKIDFKEPLESTSVESKEISLNIGWGYLRKIYKTFELDDFFNSINTKSKFNMNDINRYLVSDRILFPRSKQASFNNKDMYFAAPKYALHDSYRFLDILSNNLDGYLKQLYNGTKKLIDLDTSVLYYDCTNFYFETETEDDNDYDSDGNIIQWGLRKYGMSKEHRPNPIVQMGLFTDKNGIPLTFCIYPGSNNEQTTVIPTETKIINNYKLSRFIYCSDGGLGSYDNRFFNTLQNRDYVVTQSLKKTEEEELKHIFDDNNWRVLGLKGKDGLDVKIKLSGYKKLVDKLINGTISEDSKKFLKKYDIIYKPHPFTRDVPAKFLGNLKGVTGSLKINETVYTTFSCKYYVYQKSIFNRQLDSAKDLLNSDPDKIKKGPNDVRRFINTVSTTKAGECASEKANFIDNDVVTNEERFHGFYAVATSLDCSIEEVLAINSSRWKIEQSFRIMKTDFSSRPAFVWTDDHIIGHFAICYTALLIYRILERKLYLLNPKSNTFSTSQILNTLRNMKVINQCDAYFQSIYTGSTILGELEKLFNLSLNKKYYKPKKLFDVFDL